MNLGFSGTVLVIGALVIYSSPESSRGPGRGRPGLAAGLGEAILPKNAHFCKSTYAFGGQKADTQKNGRFRDRLQNRRGNWQ